MAEFSVAKKQELPALISLWQTCFSDEPAQIEAFFRTVQPTAFLARENGRAVSMLCAMLLPLVDAGGQAQTAAYLYAVCTAPNERGRGLCSALLRFAEAQLSSQAAFAVLVPAASSLFDFYAHQGYETAFYCKTYEVAAGADAAITPLTPDGYRALRELQLYGDFLSFEPALLRWQEQLSKSSGAGLYRVETAQYVCCAAAEKSGDRLKIKELLPDCAQAAAALAQALGCRSAEVRTDAPEQPFGMIKPLSDLPAPKTAYLGLAFD